MQPKPKKITMSRFIIDHNEKFPQLVRSPILEAVIHWEAHPSKPLDQAILGEELTKCFPDYPIIQPQHGIEIKATGTLDGMSQVSHQIQWNGFRLDNESEGYVAQFIPTGLVFSKVKIYESWETFKTEALRFWNTFVEIAEPTAINRLGVRFINRIVLEQGESISTYLMAESHRLSGLELSSHSFFYQDTYPIPNYPYQVNWVRTIQPAPEGEQILIVDIDIFTTEQFTGDHENLSIKLGEMRWLKNKIFFSNITTTALNNFGS